MEQEKKRKSSSWYRQLHHWKLTIEHTLSDPVSLKKAANCGYSKKVLENAKSLHQEIVDLDQLKKVAYGRKYAATDACNQSKAILHKVYMRHLSLARIIFKHDRGTLEKLSANGKRKTALADWLSDIRKFYFSAINEVDIKTAFKRKGIDEEELKKGIELAEEVESLNQTQKKLTEEAIDTTFNRDEKINELKNWFLEFNATTKIVGRDIQIKNDSVIALSKTIHS